MFCWQLCFLHLWRQRGFLHRIVGRLVMTTIFLVVVEIYTKWQEMFSSIATCIIVWNNSLEVQMFHNYVWVARDHNLKWKSFGTFWKKKNRIMHVTTVPYHPAMNRLDEMFLQSFKNALWTMKTSYGIKLLQCSAHNTTAVMLFLGFTLCTKLDLLKPNLTRNVWDKHLKQAEQSTYAEIIKSNQLRRTQIYTKQLWTLNWNFWVTIKLTVHQLPVSDKSIIPVHLFLLLSAPSH